MVQFNSVEVPEDIDPLDPPVAFTQGCDSAMLDALLSHPENKAKLQQIIDAVHENRLAVKEIVGMSSEEMEAAYAGACSYLSKGDSDNAMRLIGWLLFFDRRNPKYYHLGGIIAMHTQLWCLADYFFSMGLIYDDQVAPNPDLLIYGGESKIFSMERHKGLEMIRRGLALCEGQPDKVKVAKRAVSLLKRFGVKDERDSFG
jgi:hypothetical protein